MISNSLADVQDVMEFAKDRGYSLVYYSKEEWENREAQLQQTLEKNDDSTNKENGQEKKTPSATVPISLYRAHTMEKIKEESIRQALRMHHGNTTRVAKSLKIGRATLYRKIKKMKINLKIIRSTNRISSQSIYNLKKVA